MSSNTSIKVTGLTEMNLLFSQLPQAYDNIFNTVTSKYGKIMYDQMHQQVPVRTGRLKRSIGSAMSPRKMELFADAPYARAVNYGNRGRPGKPFFTGPINQHKDRMAPEINQEIGTWIRSRVKK